MSVPREALAEWLSARRPPAPLALSARLDDRVAKRPAGAPGDALGRFAERPPSLGPTTAALGAHAVALLATLCHQADGPGTKSLAIAGDATAGERQLLRERAFRLLEADALLTYALEAAAEEGPEAVRALAAWLAPARLASLLRDADAA
jgi:hypothetical protein